MDAAPDLRFLRRRTPRETVRPSAGLSLDLGVAQSPSAPPEPARRHPEHDGEVPERPPLAFLRRRTPAPRPARAAAPAPAAPAAARAAPARPASVQPSTPAAPPPVSRFPALVGFSTLRAGNPSVTIPAGQATSGAMRLHLTWSTLPTDQRSVQAGLKRSTDVHVGVLWQLDDGTAGVVQSLGDSTSAPGWGSTVLRLGPRSETDGETVTVALNQLHTLKRMVVFVYAISGRPEWDALAAQLTVELKGGVEVQIGLDDAPPDATIAALASLHRVGGDLVLRREAAYLTGQQSVVATEYGWDLPWASGRTVPVRTRRQ